MKFDNVCFAQRKIYLRDNPAELFGKHVYQVEHFHVSSEKIAARFAQYLAIHPESAVDASTPLKKSN